MSSKGESVLQKLALQNNVKSLASKIKAQINEIDQEKTKKRSAKDNSSLPILFIRNIVIFPNTLTPLFVGREKSVNAINYAFKNNLDIVIATQKTESDDIDTKNVYTVGVLAKIIHISKTSENNIRVLVEGGDRVKILKTNNRQGLQFKDADFYFADFKKLPSLKVSTNPKIIALKNNVVKNMQNLAKASTKVSAEALSGISNVSDIKILHNLLISAFNIEVDKKQQLLESNNIEDNFKKLYEITDYELDVIKYEKELSENVKEKLKNDQKKYYLHEQKKVIEEELEKISPNDEKNEFGKYLALAKKNKLPPHAVQKVSEEVARLKGASSMSSESGILKNYLDFLIALPWHQASKENIDIANAKQLLDTEHYGLEKVKERILQYIAIQSRSKKPKGQILCLYGPPGVGKTSLAKSIAKAMGKKYAKVSLGGIRDEAEIRGHRKTYIGAFAGKILSSMKAAEVVNPLILLDEIDKVGTSHKGDATAALLEVLDPEQNAKFNDHYLEIPYDLSNVTFIATANSLDMPQPLLDRMEIINVTGYTENEKLNICEKYILPRVFSETEVKPEELTINKAAMLDVIRYYTRESGVRDLRRQIQKICGKVVKDIVESQSQKTNDKKSTKKTQKNHNNKAKLAVNTENLGEYLGVKKYHFGLMDEKDQVGVVTGLAYTQSGGDILKIEAIKISSEGKGDLKTTGKLGDVIKESVQTAFSYAQSIASDFKIKPEDFKNNSVHIHFPEGATPKDGPSAGSAITLAILSLFSGKKVRRDVGITGEITLTGKVLPIGGLKEKLTAALRSGLTTIFIPQDNKKDLEEVPNEVKNSLKIIPVSSITQITKHALV